MSAPTAHVDTDGQRFYTDEQLCILREDYRADADDYPNDDQVEAFYSDAAVDAAQVDDLVVDLVVAQRQEAETFDRKERAARILADIPEDEITQDDLDWAHGTYLLWAVAWEALGKARRELRMES